MHNRWYSLFKNVLFGPFLRVYNRPEIEHVQRIPDQGAALLVSNHQAVMDSFYLPLLCPRQITFPAKSEYFTSPGLVGKAQKWFFTAVGQVPIERNAPDAYEQLLRNAETVFERGDLFGIYPEGTRSPDGRIYRGRTGTAKIALETGVPIIPIAMIGSRDANPIGSWIPRPKKVKIRVGEAIDPRAYVREQGLDIDSHDAARALTDYVMQELAALTGAEYVDVYATEVKASLDAGKGYPEGTAPRAI